MKRFIPYSIQEMLYSKQEEQKAIDNLIIYELVKEDFFEDDKKYLREKTVKDLMKYRSASRPAAIEILATEYPTAYNLLFT